MLCTARGASSNPIVQFIRSNPIVHADALFGSIALRFSLAPAAKDIIVGNYFSSSFTNERGGGAVIVVPPTLTSPEEIL